jgi:hypothetical protein
LDVSNFSALALLEARGQASRAIRATPSLWNEETKMAEQRASFIEQHPSHPASIETINLPTIAHIDQTRHGANEVDAAELPKVKCVDALALAMLDSCSGV